MDQRTDKASFRVACPQLKNEKNWPVSNFCTDPKKNVEQDSDVHIVEWTYFEEAQGFFEQNSLQAFLLLISPDITTFDFTAKPVLKV